MLLTDQTPNLDQLRDEINMAKQALVLLEDVYLIFNNYQNFNKLSQYQINELEDWHQKVKDFYRFDDSE